MPNNEKNSNWAIIISAIATLAILYLVFNVILAPKKNTTSPKPAQSTQAKKTITTPAPQPTTIKKTKATPKQASVINNQTIKKLDKPKTTTIKKSAKKAPVKKVIIKPTIVKKPKPVEIKHVWNLQGADIKSVINEISQETGRTFIIDPRVSGKVTIVSTKAIGSKEAYQIFLASLQTLGYTVVPKSNNTYEITPSTNARGIPVATGKHNGNQVVTKILSLNNESATQLVPILKPLLPQWANIQAYAAENVLIVSGTANDINTIDNIIKNIDVASSNNIDVVHLHYATAVDLANVLKSMQNTNRSQGLPPQVSISADARSNSILLSGNKTARLKMRALIASLDTPTNNSGETQVVFLHYLTAKTFAPVLGRIAQQSLKNSTKPATTTASGDDKVNLTNVQAVPNQNAIIVTAPPAMMNNLKNIVAELDVRPAQVLIEAAIVEISESQARNLGVEWGSISGSSNSTSPLADLTGGSVSSGLTNAFTSGVGIIKDGNFQLLVHAIAGTSGANVLSTPSIVVLNNHEANINVGKQINVQSEAQSNGAATTSIPNTITSTFKQQQVALTLDVKPQINQGSTVELKIKQKNDTLQNPDDPSTSNPIINISGMSTDVEVHSNDILVLGGLVKNQLTESDSKVPVLGDIPLLGNLFKYKSHKVEKKYLMVFIHPVILRNSKEDTAATEGKYNYIRRVQMAWQNGMPTNINDPSERILAPWHGKKKHQQISIPAPFTNESNNES